MMCTKFVLVAASIAKLANLVDRKELADLGMPFVASLEFAIFSLTYFFQMLLIASFAKLAETKLKVFAHLGITKDQSHIREVIRPLDKLDWFHFSLYGFLLKYCNWSRLLREMLPQTSLHIKQG